MNIGVFFRDKEQLVVLPFDKLNKNLSFEKIENGLVNLDKRGCYAITKVKRKKVNVNDFYLVFRGEISDSPFSFSANRMKKLFDEKEAIFEPLESFEFGLPNFDAYESLLLDRGFFRADKINFNKILDRISFERRMKKRKGKLENC